MELDITKLDWEKSCDKFTDHSYKSLYEFLIRKTPSNVLEIGVRLGAGFYYWKDLYNIQDVWGIDNRTLEQASKEDKLPYLEVPDWGTFIHSDIYDVDVDKLPLFDLIVDDGSHWKEHQSYALNNLHQKVNKGGLMIIEDILNLDNANYIVNNFTGDKDKIMIIDRTFVKNRIDDILIVYYN